MTHILVKHSTFDSVRIPTFKLLLIQSEVCPARPGTQHSCCVVCKTSSDYSWTYTLVHELNVNSNAQYSWCLRSEQISYSPFAFAASAGRARRAGSAGLAAARVSGLTGRRRRSLLKGGT